MGIELETLHPGDGSTFPKKGQVVCVHYVGFLPDGKVFDSSRQRDIPLEFSVGKDEVIKGWEEGIQKMSIGQRAVLTCSPDYAYGKTGYPGVIPPDCSLKFDLELIEIKIKKQ